MVGRIVISLWGSPPSAHGARISSALFLACIVAIFMPPSTSRAAEPVAFASASGTCNSSELLPIWTTAPVASNHPNVIAKYTTGAGPADWSIRERDHELSLDEPEADSFWASAPELMAGESASGNIECHSATAPVPYTAELFNTPSTPTTFSGATSFMGSPSEPWFSAPGEAQYVADLSLSAGSVELITQSHHQTFASSGEFQLGTLNKGENPVGVRSQEGPQAVWSLEIHALPVALSGVAFDRQAVEPGKIVHLAYTTSGETGVTAVIHNASGQVVRTLATALAVDRGNHTLTWDGRDQDGNLLPAGSYTAEVTTVDPSGEQQSASATTQLDSGPETIFTRKPPKLSRHREVKFAFRASTPGARFQCEYTSGWRGCTSPRVFHLVPGKYRFAVRAIDRFGIADPTPAVWRFRIRRR